ncbi:MAG: leucine-rich repeat domain-containing protein [Coriobacteriia bacterium]|nr:leucine-rich repeat domain-containing protein [Coriobacteriia bacterium]
MGGGVVIEDAFPDEKFREYVKTFDTNTDGTLSQEERDAVEAIFVDNKGIADLTGVEHFTKLTTLDCSQNSLTSLDVSKNTALKQLKCWENQLASLDVSQNTALELLQCRGNLLEELDVSNNKSLRHFSCPKQRLTELNVSENTALIYLRCSDNQLTELDLSNNTALEYLYCDENKLNKLDVTRHPALIGLECDSNQLTELDVSQNTALEELYCSDNQLTELDVSQNTALEELYCSDNQLTELDVRQNSALKKLECANNQLTSLVVSKNESLWYLGCANNQLTSLNVSNNLNLDSDDFDASDQEYSIEVDKNTLKFDLSSLPGNFNFSNAVDWSTDNVSASDNTLTFDAATPTTVTYTYKADKDRESFDFSVKLNATFVDKGTGSSSSSDIHILTFNFPGYELVINGITYKDQAKIPVKDGVKVRMPEGPKRQGYEFAYWEGSRYYAGQEYEFTSDHSLTAVWKAADESAIKRPSSDRYARDDFYSEGAQQQVVKAKPSALPKTGDASNNFAWYSILSAAVLLGSVFILKNKPFLKRN